MNGRIRFVYCDWNKCYGINPKSSTHSIENRFLYNNHQIYLDFFSSPWHKRKSQGRFKVFCSNLRNVHFKRKENNAQKNETKKQKYSTAKYKQTLALLYIVCIDWLIIGDSGDDESDISSSSISYNAFGSCLNVIDKIV